MDTLTIKSLEMTSDPRIAFADGVWIVPSQSGSGVRYRVSPSDKSPNCECEQFQLTRRACKHVLAVRALLQRQLAGDPNPSPEEIPQRPPRPTYPQLWGEYNQAQFHEKDHFQELLADLCATIPEPAPKHGRRPVPLRDRIFAAVFKVYSTVSSRRFMSDLREAHERGHTSQEMSFNIITICLDSPDTTPVLHDLIRRSALPLRAVETSFAADSTGFAFNKWTRWLDIKYGTPRKACEWVKVHCSTGTKTNVVTAAFIGDKNAADCPQFPGLMRQTAENFDVREAAGDKAYLSAENLALVEELGGTPYIPFKSNSVLNGTPVWDRLLGFFLMHREEFLPHYHQRSNVESTFSAVKRKFGDSVRAKTATAAVNEVLAKLVCQNLTCVIQEWYQLGIDPTAFLPGKPGGEAGGDPAILPMVRPR